MTPRQLVQRYPYQFRELDNLPEWQWERWRGWWTVFVRLCRQVDEALGDARGRFVWVQIKEKHGRLHCYYDLRAERACKLRIRELVDLARMDSATKCIYCGANGQLDTHTEWQRTVCQRHRDTVGAPADAILGLDDEAGAPEQ